MRQGPREPLNVTLTPQGVRPFKIVRRHLTTRQRQQVLNLPPSVFPHIRTASSLDSAQQKNSSLCPLNQTFVACSHVASHPTLWGLSTGTQMSERSCQVPLRPSFSQYSNILKYSKFRVFKNKGWSFPASSIPRVFSCGHN